MQRKHKLVSLGFGLLKYLFRHDLCNGVVYGDLNVIEVQMRPEQEDLTSDLILDPEQHAKNT